MIALLTISVALASIHVPAASASIGSSGGGGSGGQDGDVLTTEVTYTTDGSGTRGRCQWELNDGRGIAVGVYSVVWPREEDGVIYHLYLRTCPDGSAYVQIAEREPTDLLPGLLQQLKATALPHPLPVFEMLDPDFGWAYVQVPLDFRAGGDSWRRVSVTAEVGPVWATVTAVPTALTFDPGDPEGDGPVDCTGTGPTAAYVPEEPGVCSYTYRNASSTSTVDGYHFETSMSIEWSITWTSSTGAGGALDPYATSSSALLAVAEVKGLVTCTGPRPEQGGC